MTDGPGTHPPARPQLCLNRTFIHLRFPLQRTILRGQAWGKGPKRQPLPTPGRTLPAEGEGRETALGILNTLRRG